MFRLMVLHVAVFAVLGGVAHAAVVQSKKNKDVFMPKLKDTSVFIHDSEVPPEEPNMLPIKFYEPPVVSDLDNRVASLVHGMTIDIPPEFDHYGYEIRRYMSKIGNPEIYKDDKRMIQEIANVKRARVVLSYWQKAMDEKIAELDKLIEDNVAAIRPPVLTLYRQNKSVVRSFMVALQNWIDSSERFLLKAYEVRPKFENYYPEMVFIVQDQSRVEFYNLYMMKQTRLQEVRKYPPFAMMVH